MANYNVDIAVALKGAKKLTDFNKTVGNTTNQIKSLEHQLKTASKQQGLLVRSFENLNKVLADAKTNFNDGSFLGIGRNPSIINKIDIGDTIVTGGMSTYFPEGIPVGKVIEVENDGIYYSLIVELINNMTNLDNVYIIDNINKSEINSLYK